MVLPVPPPEEPLVLNLLGEQEVEEVGKAVVSTTFMGSSIVIELCSVVSVVRSSRSTKEEEKVQTWDSCTPRD